MEEASWRRHHGGGSQRHPGGIWETSGTNQGSIWDASRSLWGYLGALGRSGVSSVLSAHKMCTTLNSQSVCVLLLELLKSQLQEQQCCPVHWAALGMVIKGRTTFESFPTKRAR